MESQYSHTSDTPVHHLQLYTTHTQGYDRYDAPSRGDAIRRRHHRKSICGGQVSHIFGMCVAAYTLSYTISNNAPLHTHSSTGSFCVVAPPTWYVYGVLLVCAGVCVCGTHVSLHAPLPHSTRFARSTTARHTIVTSSLQAQLIIIACMVFLHYL